ncbi:MAG: hypothetical protein ACOCXQ_02970 [Patescibacteria group bacterium]
MNTERFPHVARGISIALLLAFAFATYAPLETAGRTHAAQRCTPMGEYTSWFKTDDGQWKRALWVWIGNGSPPDGNMEIYYNNRLVPNDGANIVQRHQKIVNGWAVYFIAKRFAARNWNWDDDWRWDTRRCN